MDTKYLFEFPRGKPYSIINSGELFRVQKTADHFDQLRRSKSFIADTYFGPFSVKESNLRSLFIDQKAVWENEWNQTQPTEAYLAWKEQLLEAIPRLNHNVLVEFALYLTFEAKFNDIKVWRAVEEAAYPILHHLTLTQICQLEWATTNIKPKHVNARLNTLLYKRALDALETTTSPHDIIDILQGFR